MTKSSNLVALILLWLNARVAIDFSDARVSSRLK